MLALFAVGWFSWTPEATGPLAVALQIGAVTAIAVAIGGGFRLIRARRDGGVLDDSTSARRYWKVVAIEFGVVGVGVVGLNAVDAGAFVPVWVCAVVGLHFFPLASLVRAPLMRWLGGIVTSVAALGLVVGLMSDTAPSTITGTGTGLALLGCASLVLFGSARPHRSGLTNR